MSESWVSSFDLSYRIDTRHITRILCCPYDDMATGANKYPQSYLMRDWMAIQHFPFALKSQMLADVSVCLFFVTEWKGQISE